jgi:hypothetical protein
MGSFITAFWANAVRRSSDSLASSSSSSTKASPTHINHLAYFFLPFNGLSSFTQPLFYKLASLWLIIQTIYLLNVSFTNYLGLAVLLV